MDLCREILILAEQATPAAWVKIDLPERTGSEIAEHVRLLMEAGLIEAANLATLNGTEWTAKRLTWAGHEFLEMSRNDTLWKKENDGDRKNGERHARSVEVHSGRACQGGDEGAVGLRRSMTLPREVLATRFVLTCVRPASLRSRMIHSLHA